MLDNETRPTNKPDCSNIAKLIEDGLTGSCWLDDSQVIGLYIYKYFSKDPRVEIVIQELK